LEKEKELKHMKTMKRILTVCMLFAMLSSLMMLTSCFGGGVEGAIDEVMNAQSYTIVTYYDNSTATVKVNQETKSIYYCVEEDGEKEEEYYWYDEEAGKYYSASIENGVVEKEELTQAEFISSYGELASSNANAASYKATLDLWTENDDGSYSYKTEDKNSVSTTTVTVKLYVDDNDALVMERTREYKISNTTTTTKTKISFSELNNTEIEIPQNVISAVIK
jgi:hypothetical protein